MEGGDADRTPPRGPLGRLRSFEHAFRGLAELLATQPNAWLHAAATAAAVALGLAFGLSRGEWAAVVGAIALVWTAEALNTAVELLADAARPEPHPLVGRAKDLAAAGVLFAAAGAALVGLLVYVPHLHALLFG